MELNALKAVLKDMNIEFEKFHTKNTFHNQKTIKKVIAKTNGRITRTQKPKGQ
jgi:arginyl-tRNA synthetase